LHVADLGFPCTTKNTRKKENTKNTEIKDTCFIYFPEIKVRWFPFSFPLPLSRSFLFLLGLGVVGKKTTAEQFRFWGLVGLVFHLFVTTLDPGGIRPK
jgi:hypothetical protein